MMTRMIQGLGYCQRNRAAGRIIKGRLSAGRHQLSAGFLYSLGAMKMESHEPYPAPLGFHGPSALPAPPHL